MWAVIRTSAADGLVGAQGIGIVDSAWVITDTSYSTPSGRKKSP